MYVIGQAGLEAAFQVPMPGTAFRAPTLAVFQTTA